MTTSVFRKLLHILKTDSLGSEAVRVQTAVLVSRMRGPSGSGAV